MIKGQVTDIAIVIIFALFSIASFFFFFIVFSGMNDAMIDGGYNTPQYDYNVLKYTEALSLVDSLIPVAMILSVLAVGISAMFLKTHPMFFIFSVIIAIFVFFAIGIYANVFSEIVDSIDSVGNIKANFPVMAGLVDNVHIYALIGLVAFLLFGYVRLRGDTT